MFESIFHDKQTAKALIFLRKTNSAIEIKYINPMGNGFHEWEVCLTNRKNVGIYRRKFFCIGKNKPSIFKALCAVNIHYINKTVNLATLPPEELALYKERRLDEVILLRMYNEKEIEMLNDIKYDK